MAYLFLIYIGVNENNIKVLFHQGKQHGLTNEIMKNILKNEDCAKLWLTDSGTNDVKQCKILKEKGIDILITDHHMSTKDNPYATIINNQTSPNVNNKELCGAGVTYKFIQYYCKKHNLNFHLHILDLVAIANIADVMPMNNYENRTFVYYGLSKINNHFLSMLCDTFIKNGAPTPNNIAWNVTPKLNALCRSNKQELKVRVFNAFVGLDSDYEGVIDELKACHTEQSNEVNKLYKKVIKQPSASYGGVIMHSIENTPYTGLIANKLLDYYKSPIMLVHENNNGVWMGSCRSPIPFKSILNNSGVMSICEGHEQAFGIGWNHISTSALITYLDTLTLDFTPQIEVTCAVDNIVEIPNDLYQMGYYNDNLWGHGLPTPTVYLKNIQLKSSDIKELGESKKTLKFKLGLTDVIMFNCSTATKEKLCVGKNEWLMLNIIGEPTLNEFRGNITPQIIIKDIEVI